MKILILNGPNLNLLGKREPEIYGKQRFEVFLASLTARYPEADIEYFQSNHEGEIIDRLQETSEREEEGVVLNAGAYTHTSLAIADCIAALDIPVVEVHISNVDGREEIRRKSHMAPFCCGIVSGFGLMSYELGLIALLKRKN